MNIGTKYFLCCLFLLELKSATTAAPEVSQKEADLKRLVYVLTVKTVTRLLNEATKNIQANNRQSRFYFW